MKITSDGANKLMKRLEDERTALKKKISDCATYVAAVSEDALRLRPEFDFKDVYMRLCEIEKEIATIKRARNEFNANTTLKKGMTIGEALVMLPILNQRAALLNNYACMQPKSRSRSLSNTKEIEYIYTNFDTVWVQNECRTVCDEIYSIQEELNLLNSTEIFEIDI